MPFEMAAPDRHDPPLAKLHRISPVAPSSAYMWPAGSTEHANTTPFAVVVGPDVVPQMAVNGFGGAIGAGVCQSTSPVAASSPDQTPSVVVEPSGSSHSL